MKIIPVFFPNSGCRHRCVFCNERMATMKGAPIDLKSAVEEAYGFYRGDRDSELALYGGTFTAMKNWREILEKSHEIVKNMGMKGIRISTRPDEIDDPVFLAEHGVVLVELGVQSMCEEVLKLSGRNHSAEDVRVSVEKLKKNGIKVSLHLMTGLPGDSKGRSIFSAFEVAGMNPDGVRIHPTLVLKNTKLEREYLEGRYLPQSLDGAVDRVADMVAIFKDDKISVERLGMYQDGKTVSNVAAGPYHPAFGELVYSRIYRKFLTKTRAVEAEGPERLRSQIIGRNKDLNLKFTKSDTVGSIGKGGRTDFETWLSDYTSSLKEMAKCDS